MTDRENYLRTIEFNYPKWIPCHVGHPLADWNALSDYNPPDIEWQTERGTRDWGEERKRIEEQRAKGRLTRGSGERLFDRLYFLRGFENLMLDFATDDPCLQQLIEMLTDYEMRRRFQDGMLHHVLRSAAEKGLPVQIHTGLQGGNANVVANGNPLCLCPVFERHADVKFSLLHVGYPFADEAIAIAKMFPNVCLDLAWHCGLSPYLAVETLKKTLGTVPTNKITWGADSHIVEEAYGAAVVFRGVLKKALWGLIEEQGTGEQRAAEVARMIMRENAAALFGLPRR